MRSLLGEIIDTEADVTVVDMEAGLEHLSRSGGTLAYADLLFVVAEPTRKGIETADRTIGLAAELGIPAAYVVGNKVRDDRDQAFVADACRQRNMELAGTVPYDDTVVEVDRRGAALVLTPGKSASDAAVRLAAFAAERLARP